MSLTELIPFLSEDRSSLVRGQTIQYCLDLTGTADGRNLIGNHDDLLRIIITLLLDKTPAMQKMAYGVLTNLAAEMKYAEKIASNNSPSIYQILLHVIMDPTNAMADDACELLCNVSRWENCCSQLFQFCQHHDIKIKQIVFIFCNLKYNEKARLDHLGLVIENLSQLSEVRRELIVSEDHLLVQLLAFVSFAQSVFRRSAVAGIIKNCCFEIDLHNLMMGETVDILPRILLPLAGPEDHDPEIMENLPLDLQYLGSDKQREPTAEIRKLLLEALLKLCGTKPCRQQMRTQQATAIVLALHKVEKNPAVHEAAESVLSVLVKDEPPTEMEDLHSLEIPEDKARLFSDKQEP